MAKGKMGNDALKGSGELRSRLLFVLLALIVFRIGSYIPVPGIDASVLSSLIENQQGTIIDMFNMFSGGALSRASIFALGIMPYISASIIIQLLTAIHPALSEIKKEGAAGMRKISKYTRYSTLLLSFIQSVGISFALPSMLPGLVPNPNMLFFVTAIISLVTGTMFLMWLGEQITERGVGNGISLIIFAGIVADLPATIAQTIEQSRQGEISLIVLLLIAFVAIAVTFFVVFVERGQRRIVVHYASRQQGRMMTPARASYLPLKVNMAGVIPAIFASSIILFPATLVRWFGENEGFGWLSDISLLLQPGQPIYLALFTAAVIFFAFFYTSMQHNPRDIADNLKKSGAFIPGYQAGSKTARHIDKIMTKITLFGGLYVAFVCLVPYIIMALWKVPFQLGGTSLLIVVVVIMDFIAQVQSYLISPQYDSVLKKANLKGSR
ncbi:MAG: preprotein translocase subunit SecY [Pasteurellales bacterium]|nr:MAG: preprotein translocase subunit SecY [Pasteurellales bacterium]